MNSQLPTTQTSFSPFRPGLKFESPNPVDPPDNTGGGGTNPAPPPPDEPEEPTGN